MHHLGVRMANQFMTLAELPAGDLHYVWRPFLPGGAVTTLESYPGSYKTSVLCDLTARITTGNSMPLDDQPAEPASVLMLNSEDPPADLRKRLKAAGADLSRVFIPSRKNLVLPDDLAAVQSLVDMYQVSMLTIDPLASFASAPLTAATAMRRLMDELNGFALRSGICVVAIRHWTKSTGSEAIYRGAGSHSITAAVRSALVIAENPHDRSQRVLAQLKNNLAAIAPSVLFRPKPHDGAVTIEWTGKSTLTAMDLIDGVSPRERPKLEEAKRILFSILANGAVLAQAARAKAHRAGISGKTLDRAKAELKVRSLRHGFGPGSMFYWELPETNDPAVSALWDSEMDVLSEQLFHGQSAKAVKLSP
jgi:hypothetical protein